MRSLLKRGLNRVLRPFDLQIVKAQQTSNLKPWDESFLKWISEARASGQDPNDVGDIKWDGNPLIGAEKYLFPYMSKDSVVLELGPGTGRMTRHVIGRCKRMILVDYSAMVCEWLQEYLRGRGDFSIHKIDAPDMRDIGDSVVDLGFAFGVLEHVDLDDTYEFLREFHRVLRPGGAFWFNFDTLATQGGLEWFRNERSRLRPGVRSIFRFYHPEDMQRLAAEAGFSVLKLHTGQDRLISIHLRKPIN
jgi:SAM-dependent methyltransferase